LVLTGEALRREEQQRGQDGGGEEEEEEEEKEKEMGERGKEDKTRPESTVDLTQHVQGEEEEEEEGALLRPVLTEIGRTSSVILLFFLRFLFAMSLFISLLSICCPLLAFSDTT
jgi:hypothetical protein